MKTCLIGCGVNFGRGWWTFALFFYINIGFINAQNLVPNYSFETYSACPTSYNCCEYASGWFKAKENINTGYTTDYLNSCGSSGFQVPSNNWGYQAASDGNAYQATATSSTSIQADYRENMYAKLTKQTIKGEKYFASFKISITEKSKYATNNFGLKLSTTNSFPVNNISQLYAKSIVSNSTGWTEIKSIIKATDNWNYIAFGNFFEDSKTSFVLFNSSISNNHCVYYVDEIILAELGFTFENLCNNNPTNFTLLSSNFIDSVKWNFNDVASGGKNTSTIRNPKHQFTKAGTFHVELIVFIKDLVDTIKKDVVINARPSASFINNDSIQCLNKNLFTPTNTTTCTTSPVIYHWDFGDGTTSDSFSPKKTYSNSGQFTLTLIAKTNKNCIDTIKKTITVLPAPTSSFNVSDTFHCFLNNYFYFFNQSTIPNGANYDSSFWDMGDGTTIKTNSCYHSYKKSGIFDVKLITKIGNFCNDTFSRKIIVGPMPKAKFSVNDSVQCFNDQNFNFTNLSTISGGFGSSLLTYKWYIGNVYSFTDKHITAYKFSTLGSYNFRLISTSQMGCSDTFEKMVYVKESPKALFYVNDSVQQIINESFNFTNFSSTNEPPLSFSWEIDPNYKSTNKDIKSYKFNKQGIFSVKLVAINKDGCTDTIIKKAYVVDAPIAEFDINDSDQCFINNNFNFINKSNSGSPITDYRWYIDSKFITSDLNILSYKFSTLGLHSIKLFVINHLGHVDSVEKFVIVNPSPVAAFEYSSPCLEQNIQFIDSSTVQSPSVINKWFWDFNDGSFSQVANPEYAYQNPNEYTVKLVVTTDKGCDDSISKKIIIDPHVSPPIIDRATVVSDKFVLIEWQEPSIGKLESYQLEKSINGFNFFNIGQFSKNITSYEDYTTFVDLKSYIYRINATDSCNYNSPYSNIGKTILIKDDTTKTHTFLYWTPYEYWNSGIEEYELQVASCNNDTDNLGTFNNLDIVNPLINSYSDSITKEIGKYYCYQVIARRYGDGLESVSNITCIPVISKYFIPNSFTPNGDEINDFFTLIGVGIYNYQVQIYSRWGEKIYESNDLIKGWDGTYKNNKCPSGVYYYVMYIEKTDGNRSFESGTVTLLR